MPFSVTIIESERGWGQRVDDVLYFEHDEDAWSYVEKFNSHNTSLTAPDWYVQANEPKYIRNLPDGAEYSILTV